MHYWFTADTHFGHANIIKYVKRPFRTLRDMDATMIRNWNNCVKNDDVVFHLGDFCFKNTKGRGEGEIHKADYYTNQLNGKIILINGNHDSNNTAKSCIDSMTLLLGGLKIHLSHRPNTGVNSHDLYLCGHVHDLWSHMRSEDGKVKYINIGVDVWNYTPVNIEGIKKYKARVERFNYLPSLKIGRVGTLTGYNESGFMADEIIDKLKEVVDGNKSK